MIWLLMQMAGWLLLAMAFFGLIGWSWAAERAAPGERALRRERDRMIGDIIRLSGGDAPASDGPERERESDAARRQLQLRDARIAELQQQVETARARAHDFASRLAEVERVTPAAAPAPAREIEVEAQTVTDDAQALQAWRLRYFEQRVRYLEGLAPAPAISPELEWRAREAEARAAHLAAELRALAASPPPQEQAPFAANAEMDMVLRWRMLYLERRVAHLQSAQPAQAPTAQPAADPEIWKWRARYLEARVRHLEQRPEGEPASAAKPAEAAEPLPARAAPRGEKPPVLSAPRHGLPDDFTLIEGLSAMQQSTLNALGVFHFEQVAAWTAEHIAWVDRYLYLRGRIEEEEWVEQAAELMREGVAGARRSLAGEDA